MHVHECNTARSFPITYSAARASCVQQKLTNFFYHNISTRKGCGGCAFEIGIHAYAMGYPCAANALGVFCTARFPQGCTEKVNSYNGLGWVSASQTLGIAHGN